MKSLFVYEDHDTFTEPELSAFNAALLAYFDHGFLIQKRNLPMYGSWQKEAKEAYSKKKKLPLLVLDGKVVWQGSYPSVDELEKIMGVTLAELHVSNKGECCYEEACDLPRHHHE